MKLEEAIEINRGVAVEADRRGLFARSNAIRLGNEALREVDRTRRLGPPRNGYLLPGETKD